jgi:hypothetical protein
MASRARAPIAACAWLLLSVGGACSDVQPSPSLDRLLPTPAASSTARPTASWRPISAAPISTRVEHTAVWTGNEMLIWGGQSFPIDRPDEAAGAAYDPETDAWRVLPDAPLPRRWAHMSVFTGSEMLIWGGMDDSDVRLRDGAAYDPETDEWRRLAPSPLRGGVGYVGAWTGTEWILVEANAPADPKPPSGLGAAYDPASNTWRRLPKAPLEPGWAASAVWTGDLLIVIRFVDDQPTGGAVYDPETNRWSAIPPNPFVGLEGFPFAIWTGDGVLITRGPIENAEGRQAGAAAWIFDPRSDDWRTAAPPPDQLPYGPPVSIGDRVVYYAPGGGQSFSYAWGDDLWSPLLVVDDRQREFWSTIWTGEEILVWGGSNPGGPMTADGRALRLRP